VTIDEIEKEFGNLIRYGQENGYDEIVSGFVEEIFPKFIAIAKTADKIVKEFKAAGTWDYNISVELADRLKNLEKDSD
jgi:hypothetical protein